MQKFFAGLLCILLLFTCERPANIPPKTEPGENGWLNFVDAPVVDLSAALSTVAGTESPEATVSLFLSSRLRLDKDWEMTLISPEERAERMKESIAQWDGIPLFSYHLEKMKYNTPDWALVAVTLILKQSSGKVERLAGFELKKQRDKWLITELPVD